jgi:hypothetical protein
MLRDELLGEMLANQSEEPAVPPGGDDIAADMLLNLGTVAQNLQAPVSAPTAADAVHARLTASALPAHRCFQGLIIEEACVFGRLRAKKGMELAASFSSIRCCVVSRL